jgi:hypothetical protein
MGAHPKMTTTKVEETTERERHDSGSLPVRHSGQFGHLRTGSQGATISLSQFLRLAVSW